MAPPERYRYIVLDGPIGAAKTGLARRLSDRLDWGPMLEQPGANPFLPKFYEDPKRHALASRLFR